MSSVVSIRIQGRIYTLRSQESEDRIQKVVAFVEAKLAETAAERPVDTVDLMILTLLNLAGEHLSLREQSRLYQENIDHCLARLAQKIEAGVDADFGC